MEDREIELALEQLEKDLKHKAEEKVKPINLTTDDKLWSNDSLTFAKTEEDYYICKLADEIIVYYFEIKEKEKPVIEISNQLFDVLSEKVIDWSQSIKWKREVFKDDLEEYNSFKLNVLASYNKKNYLKSLYSISARKALNDVMIFPEEDVFIQSDGFDPGHFPNILVSLNLRFPEVTIKNSEGKSHLIRGLIYHIDFNYDCRAYINGSRYMATGIEFEKNYLHSHLYPVTNFFKGSQCYGMTGLSSLTISKFQTSIERGNYKDLISTIREILLFIPSLVSWESLEGGPHRHLSSLKYQRSTNRLDSICQDDGVNNIEFYKITEELLINFVDKTSFKAIFGLNNGKIFIKQAVLNNLLLDLFIKNEENIEKIKKSEYFLNSDSLKKANILFTIDKIKSNRVEKRASAVDEFAHSFQIVDGTESLSNQKEEDFINQKQKYHRDHKVDFYHPIQFKDISYNNCSIVTIKLDKKKKVKKSTESTIFNPIMVNNLSNFILSNLITIKK